MSTCVDAAEGTITDQAAILASLDGLDEQVAAIATQLAELVPADGGNQDEGGAKPYQPIPTPQWWKLERDGRAEAIARLRAWVEMIYLPGYGRLAAMLAPCWDHHPLCLYTLDWLAELWSVVHLTPHRTAATLAGQSEWQTRLLPAAAEQMLMETTKCEHTQPAPTRRPAVADILGNGGQRPQRPAT